MGCKGSEVRVFSPRPIKTFPLNGRVFVLSEPGLPERALKQKSCSAKQKKVLIEAPLTEVRPDCKSGQSSHIFLRTLKQKSCSAKQKKVLIEVPSRKSVPTANRDNLLDFFYEH